MKRQKMSKNENVPIGKDDASINISMALTRVDSSSIKNILVVNQEFSKVINPNNDPMWTL